MPCCALQAVSQQAGLASKAGRTSRLTPCLPGRQQRLATLLRAQQQPGPAGSSGSSGPAGQQPYDSIPPPPPPPSSAFMGSTSATPKFQDLSWREFKERYLRPTYLQGSFILGALTLGLRVSAANYTLENNPFEFLATAVSTGVMCMALAWVAFDFTDSPPPGSNFSSPKERK